MAINFAKSVVFLSEMRYNITCMLRIMRRNRRLRLSKAVIPMEHVRLKVGRNKGIIHSVTPSWEGFAEGRHPRCKGYGDSDMDYQGTHDIVCSTSDSVRFHEKLG